MLKTLVVWLFLKKETEALKTRLAEASAALDKVAARVVLVAETDGAVAVSLAKETLAIVLASADKVRAKEEGFTQTWEKDLYAAYNAGKSTMESVFGRAESLIEKTLKVFKI